MSVSLESKFQLHLRSGEFNELIGVDSLLVRCDLTRYCMVSGRATDLILDFSVEGLELSYPFSIEPRRPNFTEVNTGRINKVRVYITGTLVSLVDLNAIPVTKKLIIRSIYESLE